MANGLAGLLGAIGTGVDALGGGVPSVYGGLLSEDELRAAKSRAQQDALAKMASALYAAGAPSRTPGGGTGQAIAQALQAGREGYQGALSGQLQEKMAQQKIQQALAAQKRTADVNQLIQGAFQQAQPAQKAPMIGGAPYGMDTPAQPAKFDFQAIAPQLMTTAEGRAALQSLQGMMKPEYKAVGDQLFEIPQFGLDGAPKLVGGVGKKTLSPDALAVMQNAFGTRDFNALSQPQQQQILSYENAPSDKDVASMIPEYAKASYETPGFTAQVPLSKSQVANSIFASSAQQPSVQQPTQAPATRTPAIPRNEAGLIQTPESLIGKPLGEKELPLIQSSALSTKDKNELAKAKPATMTAVEYAVDANRDLKSAATELLNHPGFNAAFGFGGGLASEVSGTDAADAKAILDRLQGGAFIKSITAMRQASKTGAAVGNATEKEGDKLQSALTNIKQSQSPQAARAELERLIKDIDQGEFGIVNAFERTYGKSDFRFKDIQLPTQKVKVTLPNGTIVAFPDKKSADDFKKEVGIR